MVNSREGGRKMKRRLVKGLSAWNSLLMMLLISFGSISCAKERTIPTPEAFLGFKLGDQMTKWSKIYDYLYALEKSSDRVKIIPLGKSYRGQEMIAALFSSPENLKKLDRYQEINDMISDPRKMTPDMRDRLLDEGKVFFLVEVGLHSSELGNVEAAVPTAYELASTKNEALLNAMEDVILVLNPCQHPDGYDDAVAWYEKYKNEKYWISPPYYGDFVSHDDNRCVMRLKPKHVWVSQVAHSLFKPELVWNMHQGAAEEGAFNFAAGGPKEIYPTVDWLTVLPSYAIISAAFTDMYANGYKNIVTRTGGGYSPWYIGCADTMPMYHNSIGICWEVGCHEIAKLGWGAVYAKEIILSSLRHIALNKKMLLRNKFEIANKIINRGKNEAPHAWIIPCQGQRDPVVAAEMVNVLLDLGVEVNELDQDSTISNATYPKGSYVVRLDQPLGGLAQACLEKQDFRVTGMEPAKSSAWTFPLLMGVKADRIDNPEVFNLHQSRLEKASAPAGRIEGSAKPASFILRNETNNTAVALNRIFKKGLKAYWSEAPFTTAGISYPKGTIIIPASEGVQDIVSSLAADLHLVLFGADEVPSVKARELRAPRIAAFHGWTDNMNDGWNRMVLLDHEFPFERISNAEVKSGRLGAKFDVICIPDMRARSIIEGRAEYPEEFAGGIGREGIANLQQFVKEGGTLIVMNMAAGLVTDYFDIGLKQENFSREDLNCGGSILAGVVNSEFPAGYSFAKNSQASLFCAAIPVLKVTNPSAKILVRFAKQDLELSGKLRGEKVLADRAAAVEIPMGKGKIDVFAFSLNALYQDQANFPMLFNSLYSSTAQSATIQ